MGYLSDEWELISVVCIVLLEKIDRSNSLMADYWERKLTF